jgi:hypothetical protein
MVLNLVIKDGARVDEDDRIAGLLILFLLLLE